MSKPKRLAIRDSTFGRLIPTGYSFNRAARSICITLAVRAHEVLDGRPVPPTKDDADVTIKLLPARA